jgi:hypothetical protein
VRCRNCRFTHLYRFDLEYMADDPVGVVPGHSGTCP